MCCSGHRYVSAFPAHDHMDDAQARTLNSCVAWAPCRSSRKTSEDGENQVEPMGRAPVHRVQRALNPASQGNQTIFEIQPFTTSSWRVTLPVLRCSRSHQLARTARQPRREWTGLSRYARDLRYHIVPLPCSLCAAQNLLVHQHLPVFCASLASVTDAEAETR